MSTRSMAEMDSAFRGFLENQAKQLPGRLLFAKLWGSHSHNTHLPESDFDFLAVYAAPTDRVLSLDGVPEMVDGKGPDFESHEVRKFCDLLLKGNPAMVEMLFTDRFCISSPEWDALRARRQAFLTKRAVEQYIGYARGQLIRMDKGASLHSRGGQYNTKFAYHFLRLLGDADLIASGRAPEVWKEGQEQEFLMAVRAERYSQDQVAAMMRTRVQQIENKKPWPLPDEGDRQFLNRWLLWVRGVGPRPE